MNGTLGRPRAESVNERPFVAVKRAYEFRKYSDGQVSHHMVTLQHLIDLLFIAEPPPLPFRESEFGFIDSRK